MPPSYGRTLVHAKCILDTALGLEAGMLVLVRVEMMLCFCPLLKSGVSQWDPRVETPAFLHAQVFNFDKLQEKKTWIAAQEFCRELGAQLLSLGSYEEEHFVANTLNKIFG